MPKHDAPTHTLEPQPRWKVILISLFCLMLIYEKSIDIFQEAKTDSTINVEDEMDKSLAETQEDEEASPLNPDDIFPTLHNLEEVSHSDLFQFQERLEADRGAINMNLFMDTVKKRASWVNGIGVYFKWGVLAVLFLLTLPFFYWRSLANNPNRNQLVFDSLPIYLLTTLATLYLVELLTSAALAAQSVQVIITGFGSPRLAFTDGLLQYLVYQISMHDLQGVWNFLAFNQPQLENDPLATLGALHHLSQGVQQAYESDLLRLGFAVIEQCSWMVNLIGPAFAVATFALIYGSVVPIIQQAIAHPKAVMAGEADRRLWPFIKAIFMNLWRELRATIWVIFLILCISIGAVFAVRVLVYPLVIVFIQSILATETHLRSGGALPDIGIFLTLCTMGLYLVVSMTACFGRHRHWKSISDVSSQSPQQGGIQGLPRIQICFSNRRVPDCRYGCYRRWARWNSLLGTVSPLTPTHGPPLGRTHPLRTGLSAIGLVLPGSPPFLGRKKPESHSHAHYALTEHTKRSRHTFRLSLKPI